MKLCKIHDVCAFALAFGGILCITVSPLFRDSIDGVLRFLN
jgi:hypothetical protein